MSNPLSQNRTPTRFTKGVGTRKAPDPLFMYGAPDPTDYHTYFNDFDTYVANDWTITVTGTATTALTAGDGGLLGTATSGASSDANYFQLKAESFSFELNRPAWFKARFKVSTLATVVVLGLQVTDTTPEDVTDGIYFLSTVTTGAVTAICRKNATTGSTTASAGALVADTFAEYAWYWDGKDNVFVYKDGAQIAAITGASAFIPDTTTAVSFGIRTTSANARTLTIDYILAAKARR
jgi:hypothetical protein